jgi:hypothetical protein
MRLQKQAQNNSVLKNGANTHKISNRPLNLLTVDMLSLQLSRIKTRQHDFKENN